MYQVLSIGPYRRSKDFEVNEESGSPFLSPAPLRPLLLSGFFFCLTMLYFRLLVLIELLVFIARWPVVFVCLFVALILRLFACYGLQVAQFKQSLLTFSGAESGMAGMVAAVPI